MECSNIGVSGSCGRDSEGILSRALFIFENVLLIVIDASVVVLVVIIKLLIQCRCGDRADDQSVLAVSEERVAWITHPASTAARRAW